MMELLISSALLVVAIGYLAVRIFSAKPMSMLLDKGGENKEGIFVPDFNREDLAAFFEECRRVSISPSMASEFMIAMYNTMRFEREPSAPRLEDDRYEVWGLDQEIEEVLNYILERNGVSKVRWNDNEVLELRTVKDMLIYLADRLPHLSKET